MSSPSSVSDSSHSRPLFLSIDAGVSKYRATILDERLEVIWVEEVNLDSELPQYGTRNGVHTLGDRVTAPSEMRLKALDLLLEKLSRNTSQAQLIDQIVAISGAGQPGVLHYLTPEFPSLLGSLDLFPEQRITEIVTSSCGFSIQEPASSGDTSTQTQIRLLEKHFGKLALSTSSSTSTSSTSLSSSSSISSFISSSRQHFDTLSAAQDYFVSKTGSKLLPNYSAAQLLKVRQSEDMEIENGEVPARWEERSGGGGVLGKTSRIVTESSLIASIFTGRPVPIDASDACSTNLFNPTKGDWEDEILDFVMGGRSFIYVNDNEERKSGGQRLREVLGAVEKDGTKSFGTVSEYLVKRFGFSQDTLVVPFSNTNTSTFLSFPLETTIGTDPSPQRDVLVSLSSSETDHLFIASPTFSPHPDRQYFINPVCTSDDVNDGGEDAGDSKFVAMITSKDAGLGRALSRDLYCNGSWDVFTRLVAIVPHGGSLGLDGKQFSIFFPHGQGSFVQGFQRFVDGVKVTELVDRKSNPRLIIESQFLSSRIRLSRLYSSLLTTTSSTQLSPYDPLGFPKLSKDFLPTRIILVGSASVNPAMVSILSTIMNAPTYLLLATGLKRSFFEGEDVEEYQGREEGSKERKKTSASALGSAYKAAWIWEREMKGAKEVGSFGKYLKEKLEAQESGRGGIDSQEDQAQSQHVSTYQYLPEDSPLDEEKYPISSFSPPVVPFTNHRSHQRRSSSIYTLASSSSTTQTHSRHGSIYSSATSIFSSAPPATTSASSLNNGKNKSNGVITRGGVKQKMYNPEDDELFPSKPLEEDPAGLNLVAMPDEHEFKYYSSMLPEYVRLERHALKGLI